MDVIQLLDLYQLTWWAKDRSIGDVRRAIDRSHPVVSAWEGGAMVGFTRVISDQTYRATIWDVIVRPSHQKRGVGRELMRRVFEHPDLKSVTMFLLLTADKHAFYEHLGFRSEREMSMVLHR